MRDLFLQNAVAGTIVVMIFLAVVGGILFVRGHAQSKEASLGATFLTGALFAAAAIAVQLGIEQSNFKTTVAVSSDLSGFDPNGHSLEGFNFSAKKLVGAQLDSADLEGANLALSDMADATLEGADLQGANLRYASAAHADFRGVDLRGADLEGAKFYRTALSTADLRRASVHRHTCFTLGPPLGFDLDELLQKGLVSTDADFAVLGHECAPTEVRPSTDVVDGMEFICVDGALVPRPDLCGSQD